MEGGDKKKIAHSGIRGVEAAMSHREISQQSFPFNEEEWKIIATKSTILASHCYCSSISKLSSPSGSLDNTGTAACSTSSTTPPSIPLSDQCQVCRFSNELSLTHLPEMVFPDNVLRLIHMGSGFVLEFNALDAMKLISLTSSPVQVACSEHWKASRPYSDAPETVIQPFDWTYCTEYHGTLSSSDKSEPPKVQLDPPEKLDLEKLKQHEKILFFEELTLYEDELHDNGVSNLSVKIRAMPSGFFILLRFFLRVDGVLIKLHDTRIHFEVGNNFFLRQYQTREQSFTHLAHLEAHVLTDPNLVYPYLPVTREVNEKVMLN